MVEREKKALFSHNDKMAGKPLPSTREKKRYLVFEIESKDGFTADDVFKAIYQRALSFLGELGVSRANIYILKDKYNKGLKRGVIKVNNKYMVDLKATLKVVEEINGKKVEIKSVGVSGILKKAISKYMK